MVPRDLLDAADRNQDTGLASFMESHLRLYVGAILVISAVTFASSIGLLKRRKWARVLLICLMTLFIVLNIGSVVFHLPEFSAAFREPIEYPNGLAIIFSAVMNVVASVVLAWTLKRLASRALNGEFGESF
jgi:heme/copper-type cytochrome/quinol oxidase subunit 3